jgi:NitT/TauT family transport system substrate-binding protein
VASWGRAISEVTNLLVEEEKGFFRARGIELVYLPGAGGGDAVRNLLSGQGDVAFTDPGSFYIALDKGEKLRAIYDVYPQNIFNVVALKSSGISKPADLKGKRIGIYSLSSGTRTNLQVLLHGAGLSEKDVTIVPTGLAELCAAHAGAGGCHRRHRHRSARRACAGCGRGQRDGGARRAQHVQRRLRGA